MAITRELILQQQVETPFTDAQIALIEKLSKNDEDQVIHDKTREWYTQWDQTIFEASGIEKEAREKASDYAKRAFSALKTQATEATTYKSKVATLESEIAALKDGKVDAATTQKIKDLTAEIASLKDNHQKALKEKEDALSEREQALINERVDSEFNSVLVGIQFKKDETAIALKDIALQNAKQALRSEFTMDVVDGKRVWRNKQGDIVRNPQNGNEPATTADLILPKLAPIIDQGRKATGTGTNGASGGTNPSGFNPTAKTRVDFDREAGEYLISKGLERTKPEFAAKLTELRKEFNVAQMPMT